MGTKTKQLLTAILFVFCVLSFIQCDTADDDQNNGDVRDISNNSSRGIIEYRTYYYYPHYSKLCDVRTCAETGMGDTDYVKLEFKRETIDSYKLYKVRILYAYLKWQSSHSTLESTLYEVKNFITIYHGSDSKQLSATVWSGNDPNPYIQSGGKYFGSSGWTTASENSSVRVNTDVQNYYYYYTFWLKMYGAFGTYAGSGWINMESYFQ